MTIKSFEEWISERKFMEFYQLSEFGKLEKAYEAGQKSTMPIIDNLRNSNRELLDSNGDFIEKYIIKDSDDKDV